MPVAQKGAITFALVYIPVELHAATVNKSISFNQLSRKTHARIRYKKIDESTGKEIDHSDIIKGYQYEKGKYVILTDEDFESIKTEKDRNIQILQFSELEEIRPVYFNRSYYVLAQRGGEKAFELLRRVMVERGRVAIGHTVMGSNEVMLALMPSDDGILMQTLYYDDEVRAMPKGAAQPEVGKAEMAMADTILSTMEKPFQPEEYHDQYQVRLRELIESKIEGKEMAIPKAASGGAVIDLMDALKASMEEIQGERKTAKARKAPARAKRKTGT